MKTIKILFAIVIAFISIPKVSAQSDKSNRTLGTKTIAIKTYGECDMCKKRIEKAAWSVDGIKSANWNEDTKLLVIKYNVFKKNVPEKVQLKIVAAGYDTEKYKAADIAYSALPECCRYQRRKS